VNVRRVLGRCFGLAPNIEDKAFWRMAAGLVAPNEPREFNWALLDLGALRLFSLEAVYLQSDRDGAGGISRV